MKEVKLKINVKKILKTCESIQITDKIDTKNSPEQNLSILKNIFNYDTLQIESSLCSDEEKKDIVDIIVNDACQYLIYNPNVLNELISPNTLKDENNEKFELTYVNLLNEFIKSNALIYRPEHGISRQISKDGSLENLIQSDNSIDTSSRTFTLQIDDTKFSSLKDMVQSTLEDMHRKFFYNEADFFNINIQDLKKFFKVDYCSLEDLYNKEYKDTGIPLVDYGLKIIHEKNYKLNDLCSRIKRRGIYRDKVGVDEIISPFTQEELTIIISIRQRKGSIFDEKRNHMGIINAIEYMINSTDLLKDKNRSNILVINADLNKFHENYVGGNNGLKEIIDKRINELDEEIADKKEALEKEEIKYKQAIKEEKSREEIKKLEYSINNIKNEIYSLEYSSKKENIRYKNVTTYIRSSHDLAPEQQQYIHKKIKEFARQRKVKIVTDKEAALEELKVPEEMKVEEAPEEYQMIETKEAPQTADLEEYHIVESGDLEGRESLPVKPTNTKNIISAMGLACLFLLVARYAVNSKSKTENSADVDSILDCEEASPHEKSPAKKQKDSNAS
ncbi:hypothetical protein NEMIN01_2253 [Nematocida minor]|uniref:uncharacterized protein n=1 Tax=Nematocida minor TaxID=1912983 RepID=UPI00221EB225|nr:uncharacterized protein NEMIN01_2253 [Nematocida minor]KAI5192867.1 hypothetical protein NEMIN01_2253 [Nematocida minor]